MILLPYCTLLCHTWFRNYIRKCKNFIFQKTCKLPNYQRTKVWLKIRHLNDNFFLSNFVYFGFGVLKTCTKNLVALSQKLWIFLQCLTFATYYLDHEIEYWLRKVRHYKKIHNFWDRATKFLLQDDNTLKPKHTKFGGQIHPFIERNVHFCM